MVAAAADVAAADAAAVLAAIFCCTLQAALGNSACTSLQLISLA